MPLSRQDYEAIAAVLSRNSGNVDVVEALSDYFAEDNPHFDRARFVQAAKSDDLYFTLSLRLGNAALPLDEETGGWNQQTLQGIFHTVGEVMNRINRIAVEGGSESVLDANGNRVGTVRFHH